MNAEPDTVGHLLKNLRAARGFSLRQLALLSGVSARALSYWEAGAYLPRVPELEAVLAALRALPMERADALARLDAPRGRGESLRGLLPAPSPAGLGAPTSGGDLLRALRLRRGLSLENAGGAASLSAATMSRWENGAAPPPDALDRLLAVLGARPEERAALMTGAFSGYARRLADTSLDALMTDFEAFSARIYGEMEDPLQELRFLTFAAQAWPHAARGEAGRQLLADIWARHGAYLASLHRYQEAGRQGRRALDLLWDGTARKSPGPSTWRAVIVSASARVFRGPQPNPRAGLAALRPWLTMDGESPYQAWVRADMALYANLGGDTDSAVTLAQDALRIAQEMDTAGELRLRRMDLARVQVRAGRPDSTLPYTRPLPDDSPFRRTDAHLLTAECCLAAGDTALAYENLESARAVIAASGLDHFRPRAAAIERML